MERIVRELSVFGNVYYKPLNEPHHATCPEGVETCAPPAWEERMIGVFDRTEGSLGRRHLVARGSRPSRLNYRLGRAIAHDETGFRGPADRAYRTEAGSSCSRPAASSRTSTGASRRRPRTGHMPCRRTSASVAAEPPSATSSGFSALPRVVRPPAAAAGALGDQARNPVRSDRPRARTARPRVRDLCERRRREGPAPAGIARRQVSRSMVRSEDRADDEAHSCPTAAAR